jgi:hypothetical protein
MPVNALFNGSGPPGEFPHPADNSLQDPANSLLVSINSLFCAIKFPVPVSRELSSNKLILLRSDGQILAKRPDFRKIPGIMAQLPQAGFRDYDHDGEPSKFRAGFGWGTIP